MSNIRKKNKKCCKHPKSSFSRANIRYFKHPKNQKVLQTSENQLNQGKHQICQTSEKPKSAANIRRPALPGQTLDMSNIRKTKKRCKQAKTSLTRANIRYVEHPKNQKVLQTSKNQLYHGKHPICQKPKLYQGKHQICQTSEKPKSAANIRKPALPGQTSDMSNIRKTKKCCKHPKTSFTRANIRYVKHPKNQKVLQTSENQLNQGKHQICQTSEKPKKCCKHPKTSFTRANIRYVEHPKNQKVLQTSENQLYQGKHPICQTSEKPKSAANIRKPALPGQTSDMSNIRKTKKCCKHAKTSFTRANIRYVKHPKKKAKCAANLEKQLFQGKHQIWSNIRCLKKCCKHPKTSFTRANIRYVKHPKKKQKVLQTSEKQLFQGKHPICQHPKNQKVLQTSENQLYQGKHQICQTSEKPKSAANIRKPA